MRVLPSGTVVVRNGLIEAVGANVKTFRPGDEVMGQAKGSFAELVTARADELVPKPSRLSFEQAAALPGPFALAEFVLFHFIAGLLTEFQGGAIDVVHDVLPIEVDCD